MFQSLRYRFSSNIFFKFGSWNEFIEISGDDTIGPNINTARLTSSMINGNESLTGKFVALHSDQAVQIWYHREDENPKDTPNPNGRQFRFEYKWEESKLIIFKNIVKFINLGCICGPSELVATEEWIQFSSPDYPTPYCDFMNCTQ